MAHDPAAPREPAPAPSACWCWPRPTRPATPPTWAPTSWRASARSRARRCAAARLRAAEPRQLTCRERTGERPDRRARDADVARHLEHLRGRAAARRAHAGAVREAFDRLQRFAPSRRRCRCARCRRTTSAAGRRSCTAPGLAPRSIALVLSAWRGFYRWLGREGLVAANPVEGVRAPRAAKPLPKALSVDHAVALVGASRRGGDRRRWRRATPASSSCSTAAACASASWSGSTSSPAARRPAGSTPPTPAPTCSARAASGAACRWASRRSQALAAWLAQRGELARAERAGALRQPPRHAADARARCARA